jgi:hypothetical protein
MTKLIVAAILVPVACLASVSLYADDKLEQQVREQAPLAWKKLIDNWKHVAVEADWTRTGDTPEGTPREITEHYKVLFSVPRRLVMRSTTANSLLRREDQKSNVYCENGGRAFALERVAGAAWVVTHLGPVTDSIASCLEDDAVPLVLSALRLSDQYIFDLVDDEYFSISSCEAVESSGQYGIRISFSCKPNQRSILLSGWVELLPKLNWVVAAFSVKQKLLPTDVEGTQTAICQNSYHIDSKTDEFTIKSSDIAYSYADPLSSKAMSQQSRLVFTKFITGPIAEAEFEPTAFGVDMDLTLTPVSASSRLWLWLSLSVFLFLLAIWFYRKSHEAT